jgi:hypothetical protein
LRQAYDYWQDQQGNYLEAGTFFEGVFFYFFFVKKKKKKNIPPNNAPANHPPASPPAPLRRKGRSGRTARCCVLKLFIVAVFVCGSASFPSGNTRHGALLEIPSARPRSLPRGGRQRGRAAGGARRQFAYVFVDLVQSLAAATETAGIPPPVLGFFFFV